MQVNQHGCLASYMFAIDRLQYVMCSLDSDHSCSAKVSNDIRGS